MVNLERVADDVFFFQSEVYAQVNAGVIAGPDMAVVIDTLAFPEETISIREFVQHELQVPVRYVINTHYHADHTWGNYLFPGAMIVSNELTRQLLIEKGAPALEAAQETNNQMRNIKLVLPQLTFSEGSISVKCGKKTLTLIHLPGHSLDNTGVLLEEDRVLFAGDTLMSLPYIVDGDIEVMKSSMEKIKTLGLENIVQGHGEIILRGEVEGIMDDNISYLNELIKAVKKANRRKYPLDLLEEVSVEDCGKHRIIMNGLAEDLHKRNLISLYKQMFGEEPLGSELYFE